MTAEEALLEPKKGGQTIAAKDPSDRPLVELQQLNKNGGGRFTGRSDSKYLDDALDNLHTILKDQTKKRKENKFKYCGIYFTIISLVLSFVCAVFMVGTNWFDTAIQKIITISNGTYIYRLWRYTDLELIVSIYAFNYTNVEAVLAGKEKPVLKELGPYVFKQNISKWNVHFHGIERITYSENISTVFVPEESNGTLEDVFYSPNMLIIALINSIKDSSVFIQLTVASMLKSFDAGPFWKLSVREFIYGYDEKVEVLSNIIAILDQEVTPSTGFLSSRMGLIPDEITIGTGVPDLGKRGLIQRYNGKGTMEAWEGDECNNITSTDGILLPAETVRSGETLYFFRRDFCRRLPLDFEKYTMTAQGYPVKRYRLPDHMFSYGRNFSHNYCYCRGGVCPPSGIFYPSPCYYDGPFFISKPHFMDGERVLLDDVVGLNPDPKKHSSYADVHELGVVMGAALKMQLGITVHKARYVKAMHKLKEGLALPIAWVHLSSTNLTGEANWLVYHLSYTAPKLKLSLQCGFPLLSLLLLTRLFFYFSNCSAVRSGCRSICSCR